MLALYASALPRYFTSEDFLLLRFLREHPPWDSWREFMTSSWLGISVVKFYRPISTLLLAAEARVFGAVALGYNAVHLLVHLLNAYLVWRIARRIAGAAAEAWVPVAIALLFALYPLHPNTVSFIASFATLFSTSFLLLAFDAYQRRALGQSLAAFLLALGSYEAAVVLPGFLLAHDLLVPDDAPAPAARSRARLVVRSWVPFAVATAGYLVLRRAVLGFAIGGYEEAGRRLLAPQLLIWGRDFVLSVWWLHMPRFDNAPSTAVAGWWTAALVGVPATLGLLRWKTAPDARRWIFAWVWVVLSLLPFSFTPAVPGNGRYWYLASIGLAMTIGFLARWLLPAARFGKYPAFTAVGLVGVFWAFLLAHYVGAYGEAARTARSIQQQLVRIDAQQSVGSLIFVTNYPLFLNDARQTPIAQIYHYGLADALHPPFTDVPVRIYPLPLLSDRELEAVTRGRPQARVERWEPLEGIFHRVDTALHEQLAELAPAFPTDGATIDRSGLFATATATPSAVTYRLILVAEGNAAVVEAAVQPEGMVRAAMPQEFVESMTHLYGSEMFWWIEGRDAGGLAVAVSPLCGFRFSARGESSPATLSSSPHDARAASAAQPGLRGAVLSAGRRSADPGALPPRVSRRPDARPLALEVP